MVLQRGEPELGDTSLSILLALLNLGDTSSLLLLILVLILVISVDVLTGGDLLICGLGLTGNDGRSTLVKGSVFGEELAVSTGQTAVPAFEPTFFSNSRMAIWNSLSIFECSAWIPFKPSIRRRTGAGNDLM